MPDLTCREYITAPGWIAGVIFLGTLSEQLPPAVMKDQAQFFLVALVQRLANDEDKDVKFHCGKAISTLFAKADDSSFASLHKLTLEWYDYESNTKGERASALRCVA